MSGEGRDWTPAFPGQRPPFQPGHEISVKHGAYADVKLGPRVEELAETVRVLVGPLYRESDELAVRLLAMCLARIEAAEAALAEAEPGDLARLQADMRGWTNTSRRLLNDLGLTPAARARLGLDVARTRHVASLSSLPETEAEADAVEESS
jgi:hypothetical protein